MGANLLQWSFCHMYANIIILCYTPKTNVLCQLYFNRKQRLIALPNIPTLDLGFEHLSAVIKIPLGEGK